MTRSFSSGSTIFGDTLDDSHQFTGSLIVTGSRLIQHLKVYYGIFNGGDISGSFNKITSGIISGSGQLPSGTISGSSQLPSGIVSGSGQLDSNGTISGTDHYTLTKWNHKWF